MAVAEVAVLHGVEETPEIAFHHGMEWASCRARGCASLPEVRCAYVDGSGQPCGTRWCSLHSQTVGEHHYCRRHASTVLALAGKAGDPRALPPVKHRGASLVSWVFSDGFPILNAAVLAGVGQGEVVFEDSSVNVSHAPRGGRRWERGWRIAGPGGIVRKVLLRVDENDDSVISLVDGDRVVARGIPPWITRRRRGDRVGPAREAADRRQFYAFMEKFIRTATAHAEPTRASCGSLDMGG